MDFYRYRREDLVKELERATSKCTGVRKPTMWVCDCGCDIAQWFCRTDRGLAFTQQAWPAGVTPKVVIMETRADVERFVHLTVERMHAAAVAAGKWSPAAEARIKSFEAAVWSAWSDS